MTNPRKAKGTKMETDTVRFLQSLGIPARRNTPNGRLDTGDIHGVEPFVIQAKDWASVTDALRAGVDGAVVQAARAGQPFGVGVVRRAQSNISRAYAVTTLDTLARVILRIRLLEDTLARHAPEAWQELQETSSTS